MDTERIILDKLDLFIERIERKDVRVIDELWSDGRFAMTSAVSEPEPARPWMMP